MSELRASLPRWRPPKISVIVASALVEPVNEVIENSNKLAFGTFEVDIDGGELYKSGYRVKIQSQPFRVLLALLEKPGCVVSREELRIPIWGRDTMVEFDRSLAAAINKVREALGDSADNPRFIETLARRGYRFIAPVQRLKAPASSATSPELSFAPLPPPISPVASSVSVAPPGRYTPGLSSVGEDVEPIPAQMPVPLELDKSKHRGRSNRYSAGTLSLLAVLIVIFAADGLMRYEQARKSAVNLPPHIMRITNAGNLLASFQYQDNLVGLDTDGVRLFVSVLRNGQAQLVAVSLSDGAMADIPVPEEVVNPVLGAVSPDGARLLVRSELSRESDQPLWVVPTMGGSALRVGSVLAHDATWMSDGNTILYAAGNELYTTRLTDGAPQLYAKLSGQAYWMRWSPDGALLRFTILEPVSHSLSLWQISSSDRTPEPVLPNWGAPDSVCCGTWSADGARYVFQLQHGGETNLWMLESKASKMPHPLTDGPLQFKAPVASRTGDRIFFLGSDARFAMKRYIAARRDNPVEEPWLEDAIRVTYSRDGQWVAWTTPNGSLWRARPDGSQRLQLTPADMEVFLADWSPDGSSLAIMARDPGHAWHIYFVSSAGGSPKLAVEDRRGAGDPSWSPDGRSLVYGRLNDVMGKESSDRKLQILDVRTGHITTMPGSDGLYSPRWSPDGRYIAALSLNGRKVELFNFKESKWTELPLSSGADPHWSADSRSLFVHEFTNPLQPIVRVSVPELKIEETLPLFKPGDHSGVEFTFSGVTPTGDMLVRARNNMADLYALSIEGSNHN